MKKKFLFVLPRPNAAKKLRGYFNFPNYAALIILSMVKKYGWDVELLDENIDRVSYDTDADLVGISIMTATALRGYELASGFRKRGVQVIIGGVHATLMPEEAAKYADAVVIGEGEPVMPEILKDYEQGVLKKFYRATKPIDMEEDFPDVDHSIWAKKRYKIKSVLQVGRGCPLNCSFCSVSRIYGKVYRHRKVSDIIKEIIQMHSKLIGFLDDNVIVNRKFAMELFSRLAPLRKLWVMQTSMNLAYDTELLKSAVKAGLRGVFVGFESIKEDTLKSGVGVKSRVNTPFKYKEVVSRFHEYGVGVLGAFIFGFDDDDVSIFEKTVEVALKIGLDFAQFTVLTPLPGTELRRKLEAEGRIFDNNWDHYNVDRVVFYPKQMTPEQLQQGTDWAWSQFYSNRNIIRRMLRLSLPPYTLPFLLGLNLGYQRLIKKEGRFVSRLHL